MMSKKNILPIYFALLLIIGIYIGNALNFNVSSKANVNKFDLILEQVESIYVDSVNQDELIEKAVNKLLLELDPHSSYIEAKDLQSVNEPMEGSFDGIGVEFKLQEDTILVVAPISGGPSELVGIQSGDKIVAVDSLVIAGTELTNKKVFDLLRGKRGTKVLLGIKRGNERELINFEVTRGKIPIHSLDVAYMIDEEVGYLKVNRFSATTFDEFKSASKKLLKQGMQTMLLDLRNNPGGYLGASINIVNEFLEEDKLIVYTKGRQRKEQKYYSTQEGLLKDIKVVVLINEGSASASEIVAGAIQDNDRGLIVGRRSFGKGLVQEQFDMPDGSAYRITTQRYYTPTGRCIQRPYMKGKSEDYEFDIIERMDNGELLSADSIPTSDSLIFTTPKGKIVYGGGGITPDTFIAIDTTSYHKDILLAIRKDLIRSFAFEFTNKNRSRLKIQALNEYITYYEIDQSTLSSFQTFCANKDVSIDFSSFDLDDLKILKTQLKAFIGRNIWNDEAYFPIIHQLDNTLQMALIST